MSIKFARGFFFYLHASLFVTRIFNLFPEPGLGTRMEKRVSISTILGKKYRQVGIDTALTALVSDLKNRYYKGPILYVWYLKPKFTILRHLGVGIS